MDVACLAADAHAADARPGNDHEGHASALGTYVRYLSKGLGHALSEEALRKLRWWHLGVVHLRKTGRELYARPFKSKEPVVALDERPVQLLDSERAGIPMRLESQDNLSTHTERSLIVGLRESRPLPGPAASVLEPA